MMKKIHFSGITFFLAITLLSQAQTKVAEGESLQEAINNAKPHAVIEVAAGSFPEGLIIDKPLTLRGAGWDQTIINPTQKSLPKNHALLVENADGVKLEKLQISLPGPSVSPDSERPKDMVHLVAANIHFEQCAIIGPGGHGIVVATGSKAKITRSLVAGFWGTGIRVTGRPTDGSSEPSELQLDQSVVRSCYHRNVALGAGCDTSSITRSWISGSAWHGIRYDSASPRIEKNYLSGNARFGIYANGKTKATIKENCFADNEMGGISCWDKNEDLIEANHFINNHREAIMTLDSSKPTIRKNIFLHRKGAAIVYSYTNKPDESGSAILEGNVGDFGTIPLKVGNEVRDSIEGFTIKEKPMKLSYGKSLLLPDLQWPTGPLAKPDSNPEPIHRSHLWPKLLPAEIGILPEGKTRNFSEWKKPDRPSPKVRNQHDNSIVDARPIVEDLFQLDDLAKKKAAIETIRKALESQDKSARMTALTAFNGSADVRFEKASFHKLILPLLKSSDAQIRTQAAPALLFSGLQEGDLAKIGSLLIDPEPSARISAAGTIIHALGKDLTKTDFEDQFVSLLEDPLTQKQLLHSLWGAKLSPKIEGAVLALSRSTDVGGANTNDIAYSALYFALSTQANKSEATVKRLIEYLAAKDITNIAGRAAWGLGQGVDPAQHDLVIEGALKFMAARNPGNYGFTQCTARLKQYAAKKHQPAISEFLKKPGIGEELKIELGQIVENLK